MNDLRLAGTEHRIAQAGDRVLGLVEGRRLAAAVGHRVAVVQEHDVVRGPAAEEAAAALRQQRLRQRQHDQRDRRHPQQQQQQLLEDDPRPVFLLAGQQELHRRPMHGLVPEHVDQVDQHGDGDEPQSPIKRMDGGSMKFSVFSFQS